MSNETASAWVSFDQGMQATGASAEQSKSFFETLTSAILKTGGSIDDVKETIELFNTALTEGTVSGEDLQELMKERMPRAFEESAKAAGMTNEELAKFLESGASMNDLIPILEKGIKNAFGDSTRIEGMSAATGRLKNSLVNLFTDETTGSITFFSNIIDGLASGINGFNRMIEEGQADVAQWIGNIAAIKDYVSGDIKSLSDLKEKLKQLDEDHTSDLKLIADAHDKVSKSSTESGNSQDAAATKAALKNSELKKKISDIIDEYDRLSGTAQLVSGVLSSIGKDIDFSNPKKSVELMTSALESLAEKEKLSSAEINEGLLPAFKNLSDTNLDVLLKELVSQTGNYEVGTEKAALKTAALNEKQSRLSESAIALAQSNLSLAEAESKTAEETP